MMFTMQAIGPLLAQMETAPAGSVTGWLSALVQLGSFGVLVYLIVVGLPALQKGVAAERKLERDDFATALNVVTADRKLERADFATALKVITDFAYHQIELIRATAREEMTTVRAEMQVAREAAVVEQRDVRQTQAAEAEAMRKLCFEMAGAMRTAVHDIRDTAGITVNKANLALEIDRQRHAP